MVTTKEGESVEVVMDVRVRGMFIASPSIVGALCRLMKPRFARGIRTTLESTSRPLSSIRDSSKFARPLAMFTEKHFHITV